MFLFFISFCSLYTFLLAEYYDTFSTSNVEMLTEEMDFSVLWVLNTIELGDCYLRKGS